MAEKNEAAKVHRLRSAIRTTRAKFINGTPSWQRTSGKQERSLSDRVRRASNALPLVTDFAVLSKSDRENGKLDQLLAVRLG